MLFKAVDFSREYASASSRTLQLFDRKPLSESIARYLFRFDVRQQLLCRPVRLPGMRQFNVPFESSLISEQE
jgi:hypothetical protein